MAWKQYSSNQLSLKSGTFQITFKWENATSESNTLTSKIWNISDLKVPFRTEGGAGIRFSSMDITFAYDTEMQNFLEEISTDGKKYDVTVQVYLDSVEIWRGLLDYGNIKVKDTYSSSGLYVSKRVKLKINDTLWWFKVHDEDLSDYLNQWDPLWVFFHNIAVARGWSGISDVYISDTLDYTEPMGNYGLDEIVINYSGSSWVEDKKVIDFLGKLMQGIGGNIYNLNNKIRVISIEGETPADSSLDVKKIKDFGEYSKEYMKVDFGLAHDSNGTLGDIEFAGTRGGYKDVEIMKLIINLSDYLPYTMITDSSWTEGTLIDSGTFDSHDLNNVEEFDFSEQSEYNGYCSFVDNDPDTTEDFYIGYIQDDSADFFSKNIQVGDKLKIINYSSDEQSFTVFDTTSTRIYFISNSSIFDSFTDGWRYEISRGSFTRDPGGADEAVYQWKIWRFAELVLQRYYNCYGGNPKKYRIEVSDVSSNFNINTQKEVSSENFRVTRAAFDLINDRVKLNIMGVSSG